MPAPPPEPPVDPPLVHQLLSLRGRRALVAGASGGLGAALARRFAEAGAEVICHAHTATGRAEALADELRAAHRTARVEAADLSDPDAARALIGRCAPLHILVHAAARQDLAPLIDTTSALWRDVMAANLDSAHALLAAFAAQPEPAAEDRAAVLISSIEAARPAPGHGAYAAAKAGLEMLARAAAHEYAPVRVNALAPGLIDRPGLAEQWPEGLARWRAAAPLHRPADPSEIADAALFLASDAARFVTGTTLTADGGLSATPGW